jgi:hypothetical protein
MPAESLDHGLHMKLVELNFTILDIQCARGAGSRAVWPGRSVAW